MKPNVPLLLAMTVAILVTSIGVVIAAEPKVHTVDVTLKSDDIGCYVAGPDCDDKVDDAKRGDVVRFNLKNQCSLAVALHVGRFQPKYVGEKDAGNPLEGACLKDVRLKPSSSTVVECRVKRLAVENRTYKYSILSGQRLLRDPQIEVVKP